MAHYVDTSALVKLVVIELETPALRGWLFSEERDLVSCDLTRTELLRVVRRAAPERAVQARALLESITLMQVGTSIFTEAGRLEPTMLRTLDAIHLAAALALGDDLESVGTYDERLAQAARLNGVGVTCPT